MSATNRNGAPRIPLDNYPTPAWLTHAILDVIENFLPAYLPRDHIRVLEPAACEGAIVKVLRERGFTDVTAFDIADPHKPVDFLSYPVRNNGEAYGYDLIITNPPYSLAQEFIERAFLWRRDTRPLHQSFVAMLLRLNFLGSQKRARWLREHTPSVYVTPRRPCFSRNKHGRLGSDSTEYCWLLWGPEYPTVHILPTEVAAHKQLDKQHEIALQVTH